jgi:hypothetical protein
METQYRGRVGAWTKSQALLQARLDPVSWTAFQLGDKESTMPRRIKIDIAAGKLSSLEDVGNLREAKAENIEQRDGIESP